MGNNVDFPDGSLLQLVSFGFKLPDGQTLEGTGITPDIEVQQARIETIPTNRRQSRESDLRGALDQRNKNGAGKLDNKTDPGKEAAATPPQDFQLQRALDLLRGIDLFTKRLKG